MMKSYRRIRRRSSHETAIGRKENQQENLFFANTGEQSFFQPAGSVQHKCEKCENEKTHMKPDEYAGLSTENYSTTGYGDFTQNKVNYANCAGVKVQGRTDANYTNSYSMSGATQPASGCKGCSGAQCISFSGELVSVFQANPRVTLPPVPGGLNACEQLAVKNFIATTLTQHEQQHVAAFNTYTGTITTPVSFTGCRTALDGHARSIHNGLEVPRKIAADNLSDALDANGANIFTVTCKCPDPEPPASEKK